MSTSVCPNHAIIMVIEIGSINSCSWYICEDFRVNPKDQEALECIRPCIVREGQLRLSFVINFLPTNFVFVTDFGSLTLIEIFTI